MAIPRDPNTNKKSSTKLWGDLWILSMGKGLGRYYLNKLLLSRLFSRSETLCSHPKLIIATVLVSETTCGSEQA